MNINEQDCTYPASKEKCNSKLTPPEGGKGGKNKSDQNLLFCC